MENTTLPQTPKKLSNKPAGFFARLAQQKVLLAMSIPFLIWLLIFKYLPIWGWTIAFQDYKPAKSFSNQEWVGFEHFIALFSDDRFLRILRNTLAMSTINLILGFTTAIALALLLNEVRNIAFKRVTQTISYLPHFLSWVVAASIVQQTLSPDGIINQILIWTGFVEKGGEILFLGIGEAFWGIFGATYVWKEIGWNTIVYLAAMTMIDPSQYEAADIDGAGRFQKMFYITLPGIKPVIVVLLIMSIGQLLLAGFEPQYLLGNGLNVDYSEVIDIFVLKYGIGHGNFSLGVAAGIFKTVVSFVLLFGANNLAKRLGEDRLF
ncbi:ABC transporter permease subunit [Paenibacillus sp. TRM 82003]|nr:ABC transporter permease subunit [Paenibacillus sp. TRM 82003]